MADSRTPARRPRARAPAPRGLRARGRPGTTTTPGSAPRIGAKCCAIRRALPPDIRALLEAENAYADEVLGSDAPAAARNSCAKCARACKEDDSEPPAPDGPYSYYSRFRHGGQHRIYCRRPRAGGQGDRAARRRRARRRARRFSNSAPRAIRPIIAGSPGARTTRARKCTPSRVRDVAAGHRSGRPRREHDRRNRLDARLPRLPLCRCRTKTTAPAA